MKYGRIDAALHKLDEIDADQIDEAKRLCGLAPLRTDHGQLQHRDGVGGIGIVVAEFGLFEPPLNQHYFAIDGRLFAGNALLYGYDAFGLDVDIGDVSLIAVRWFASGYDVSKAITRGELIRPQLTLNGTVVWEWPQPRPNLQRLARQMVWVEE